ncbi:receptor-like protein EIX2 [Quercus suber]|nr:receptor-like protein EIX2 [Quercus suber]
MITFPGGWFLKLLHGFLMLLVHLSPFLGFISGAGVGDANNIRCLERERLALLEFKKGLVDDNGMLSSWGSEDENKNCCNWEGVNCRQTNHVLELHLGAYQNNRVQRLQGTISPSLLALTHLTLLDLSGNNFNQSHIPEFIGSLINLKYLDLSNADFSGPIPLQLGNLLHLQNLNLEGNNLTIIENLKWLSHLSLVKDLDLALTNLSVANDWLEVGSRLPHLTTLNLWSCNLPSMSLSSLPPFNYSKSFTSLESLILFGNQFDIIPKSFGNICTLRELDLSENNLNGQLFELINNLSAGCAKDSLEVLDLSGNQITGSLPNLAIFPSLKEIFLQYNNLNGTVPKSIGNLFNLEVLFVSSNFLHGVISEAHFSNLSKLRYLGLSNNSFTLEFSFNWVPPFQLEGIYLGSCMLGPRFPNWIQTQRNISNLKISYARISDTIPMWFADLPPTLRVIDFSSNHIDGRLPDLSIKCMYLEEINLSVNRLEGPLPLLPTNLSILNLSENRFSGSISSICEINGGLLKYLDLSHNLLSGKLPNCFMHWPNLVILNFTGNNFYGEVPSSLGLLSQLQTVSLSYNSFSGDLPLSLKNCSLLTFINFENNRFFGTVPTWIGEDLPQLIILILRSNKFYGSIPLNLCWLKYLRILDLSINDISGSIPRCIDNFTAMAEKGDSSTDIISSVYNYSYDEHLIFEKIYVDSARIAWKGRDDEYRKNLGLLKIINLSSNKLTGKLPSQISSLLQLVGLDVSKTT